MKIGIIGSGEVAQSLGKGLVALGHDVMISSRDPKRKDLSAWKTKIGKKGRIGTTTEAANFGEICFLAVAWHAGEDVIAQVRPELAAKVVIDVTNPLEYSDDGPPQLAIGHDISAGEIVQASLPDSHVVKALNIINHKNMVNPKFKSGTPTMFICGNNKSAITHATELLEQMGWEDIVYIGGIEKARILEPLCLLWVEYGIANNTWDHGISILRD